MTFTFSHRLFTFIHSSPDNVRMSEKICSVLFKRVFEISNVWLTFKILSVVRFLYLMIFGLVLMQLIKKHTMIITILNSKQLKTLLYYNNNIMTLQKCKKIHMRTYNNTFQNVFNTFIFTNWEYCTQQLQLCINFQMLLYVFAFGSDSYLLN